MYSKEGDVILAGDLNAKTNIESDFVSDIQDDHSPINDISIYSYDLPMPRKNMDKHPVDTQGQNFLQLCKNSNLRILNGRCRGDRLGNLTRFPMALRESPSTLDYLATHTQLMKLVRSMTVLPHYGLPDHNCLCLAVTAKFSVDQVSTEVQVNKPEHINYASSPDFLRRLCSPIGQGKIRSFFENCKSENETTIDMMHSEFVEIFISCATNTGTSLPKKRGKKISNTKKPWYSSECKVLKSALNRAEKNFRKDPFNRGLLQILIKARKNFKNKCKESEKKLRNSISEKLLSISEQNPTEFWSLIKRMRKWGSPGSDPADSIHPSEWLSHFKSLLNEGLKNPRSRLQEMESLEKEPHFSELDFRISRKEIDTAFKKLNKNASEGPDRVSGKLLYAARDHLIPLLHIMFDKAFCHVSHPSIWGENFLKSILKKGDTGDPNNYRGIAVGSIVGKLFNLIMLGRLEKRIQESNPISCNQIGFTKGHRTADHIFVMKTIVDKIVRVERKRLFVAFIDFRKAYDRINRDLLFLKLQKSGIRGTFYRNIKAMYNSILYRVKVKGGTLDPITSRLGLKQGGVLSPLLFNIFIDDMKGIFNESCDPVKLLERPLSHLLYADDLVLMSTSETGLNKCLKNLAVYCETWQLEVNLKKSQVVIFNKSGRKLTNLNFIFQGKTMEVVKSYCYLGIDIYPSGSFRTSIANLMDKARKAIFPLFSTITQFQLPCSNGINLFNSLIKPICLYNAENLAQLSNHQIESLQEKKVSLLTYMLQAEHTKVQMKFMKFILGVNRNCSNVATLGEVGELPLFLNGLLALLSFWHRIANLTEETLVKQALNAQTRAEHDSEWLATVKFLLSELNLNEHLANPALATGNQFSILCKSKLKDLFLQQWTAELTGMNAANPQSSKLRFYKLFKTTFRREPYLMEISNFYLRKRLTKFRCSDHNLEIEVGRHKNIDAKHRVCRICRNDIETEEHFLRFCPAYSDLRNRYFGGTNTFIEWREILKCTDKKTSYAVANYLTKAQKIRDSILDGL